MKNKSLLAMGRKFSFIVLLSCICNSVYSQAYILSDNIVQKNEKNDSAAKLCLKKIFITGNKKTKSYIILREMQMRPGDSVNNSQMLTELEKARSFIYNTTLFVEVVVTPHIINSHDFDITVSVVERWYVFPIPVFDLADRSFNEWVEKYNANLNRVSYGIRFHHKNASGRNDQFSVTFINGFTRNISFNYKAPYSNPSLTEGVAVDGGFSQTRQIPFKTNYQNDILFFKNDNFVKNEWFVSGSYISRKGLKKKETFSLSFHHLKVDDSIISQQFNPGFFNSKSASQNFPEIEYRLQFISVDNILYPLKGYTTSFIINKRGLQLKDNINRLKIKAVHNAYFTYSNNWYFSFRLSGEIKLPFAQPYINRRALGYGDDYLRGDEYYVIDAVASTIAKFDLKTEIVKFYLPTFIKSPTYNRIPFTIYAKAFTDLGYAYIQQQFDTRLNNRLLYAGGLGIDILTLYDFKLSIELSFNQLGEKGLFLHY
ncbi:MAG: POTRA domain-containing protein [Ginsengibacter sp.]